MLAAREAGGLRARAWVNRPHCVLRESGALVLTKRLLRGTRRVSNVATMAQHATGRVRLDEDDCRVFHLDRFANQADDLFLEQEQGDIDDKSAAAADPYDVLRFIRSCNSRAAAESPRTERNGTARVAAKLS